MPPDNAGFLYAAYALTVLVFAGYAAVLVRRRARVRRALARSADGASGGAEANGR